MANLAAIADNQGGYIMEDTETHRFRIKVKSSSSHNLYVVSQNKRDTLWECSCKGWIFQHNKHAGQFLCRHLRAVVPQIENSTEYLGAGKSQIKGKKTKMATKSKTKTKAKVKSIAPKKKQPRVTKKFKKEVIDDTLEAVKKMLHDQIDWNLVDINQQSPADLIRNALTFLEEKKEVNG